MYQWLSTAPFVNDNHLARLTVTYPLSLHGLTGNVTVHRNGIIDTTMTVIKYPTEVKLFFASGTVLPPNTDIIITIDSVEIKDNQNYYNQYYSYIIDFVASPVESSLYDNVSSCLPFNTIKEFTPLPIDTTKVMIKELEEEYLFYPNPVKGELHFKYTILKTSKINVTAYSLSGQKVMGETFVSDKGSHEKTMRLPYGIYNVVVFNNGKYLMTQTIVK